MRVQKKLAGMLAGTMLLSIMTTGAGAATFTDMPNNWSTAALQKAVDNGLIQGSNGKINAEGLLTRAEMAAIVNRAFGATKTASISQFTDVSSNAWYYTDMQKAVQMGTFEGSNNKLTPDSKITREQAFTVLARAFHMEDGSASALNSFSDSGSVSSWAKGPIAALVAGGYVNGSNGKLTPTASITRAEFAQIMDNLVKTYAPSGTVSGNAIVKTAGTTLSNATVSGDLVIGDGVGTGDVTLDNTTVSGRLVVRGGGINSIHINGTSSIAEVVVANPSNGVRIAVANTAKVKNLVVSGGTEDVILTGPIDKVTVATATVPVELRDATVSEMNVSANNADVTVNSGTKVTTLNVDQAAAGAELNVAGKVTTLNTAADSVKVSGNGKIDKMTVTGGSGVTVDSSVTVDKIENKGSSNVTVGGTEVKPDGSTSSNNNNNNNDNNNSSSTTYRYKVAIGTTAHGKITSDVTRTNKKDTKVTLTATADAGYILKAGSLAVTRGTEKVSMTGNTFIMDEAGTYSVSAEFVQDYKVEVTAPQNGTLTYTLNGDTMTVVATPATGYQTEKVMVKAGDAAAQEIQMTNGAYTYKMTDSKVVYTISATFTAVPVEPEQEYKVEVTAPQNGTLTYSIEDDTMTIVATPATDYKVDKVMVKAGDAAAQEVTLTGGKYTYELTSYDVTYTVSATFAEKQYQVSKINPANGTLTYKIDGRSLYITPTPNAGYKVEKVMVQAGSEAAQEIEMIGGKYPYKLTSYDVTYTVSATFVAKQYQVSKTDPANGTLTYVINGDTLVITATPSSDNYVLASDTAVVVTANGTPVTVTKNADGTFSATLTNYDATYAISATFKANFLLALPEGATFETYKNGDDTCVRVVLSDYNTASDTVTVTVKGDATPVTVDYMKNNDSGKHEFTFEVDYATPAKEYIFTKTTTPATLTAAKTIQAATKLANRAL